ncbi:zinc-binding dehydrogenase [Thermocatellispora tengchongensis]|uniref:zinc-binding dehydrogenase n=1 Tax=Thermocatellispora tengchongensis TaxID=1073253 RepID=UPI003627446B
MVNFIAIPTRDDLTALCELIEAGQLTPVIGATYPLDQAAAAMAHLETGHARGKIVVTV